MDAALDQIADRGVLSGLNLTEVADAAGVKPANIYYWFGSREGLLRAALARELQELAPPAVDGSEPSFAERRLAVFDAISASDRIRLTALMALDDDPDYEPLPHIDASRAFYRSLIDGGACRRTPTSTLPTSSRSPRRSGSRSTPTRSHASWARPDRSSERGLGPCSPPCSTRWPATRAHRARRTPSVIAERP